MLLETNNNYDLHTNGWVVIANTRKLGIRILISLTYNLHPTFLCRTISSYHWWLLVNSQSHGNTKTQELGERPFGKDWEILLNPHTLDRHLFAMVWFIIQVLTNISRVIGLDFSCKVISGLSLLVLINISRRDRQVIFNHFMNMVFNQHFYRDA